MASLSQVSRFVPVEPRLLEVVCDMVELAVLKGTGARDADGAGGPNEGG